ncbi:dihydrolipoamide acetyltransferase family protein [Catenulispora pinistramenti]|uniref:dihydrolipoamide acetyltransferase family protein n=1 Tax=Catenulispora pinistramenti TaxID=2705254 RepID=UPI001BAAF258|nr:dihydrolipoamide acetyltransferase family protein [Catenulispora pinistramenti]
MSTREFLLPDLGEGLTEAEIIAWHVAVGEHVGVDQVVCEVETAKASVEVPCPYAGEVVELYGAVGDVIDVGKPLISIATTADNGPDKLGPAPEEPADRARLDAEARNGAAKAGAAKSGDSKSGATKSGAVLVGYGTTESTGVRRRRVVSGFGGHAAAPPRVHVAPVLPPANGTAPNRAGATPVAEPESEPTGRKNGGRIAVVSPLVRRVAKEGGLDLASVRGSGPEGLIMRRDVEAALAAPAVAPGSVTSATSVTSAATGITERERVPLRGLRKTVADKLSRSRREIPDATTWVDVDATGLMELRAALNRDASERKISLLAVLARICVAGLARYPELNATVDVERQEIVRYSDVNLGFAAQTDRGLVVPVVHGADRMSTEELAAEFERLTAAARSGSLPVADLTGSTFTLNNYGVYGVDGSTPILNHPEAAMLGVGRIVKKPWVVSGAGGDELAIRQVTQLSFTFDHRVCDGGVAGGFLRYVADLVEEPARLLRGL